MEDLKNFNFDPNTIIDIVILPDTNIQSVVSILTRNFENVVIIDTRGQLLLASQNAHRQNSSEKKVQHIPVFTFKGICDNLTILKESRGFVLVIDSITFVCDTRPAWIKDIARTLWSLIYECNATVITVNHYRMDMNKLKSTRVVPRMGKFWEKIVSYQVLFYSESGRMRFVVNENNLLGM